MPQVILLDLALPKIDGFEVLRRIKSDERTRRLPTVILTSSENQEACVSRWAMRRPSWRGRSPELHALPSMPSTDGGEIVGPLPLCPVHKCFVGLVEMVRDGDDHEKGGYETGNPRREYEAVHEERGHPHPEAELTSQQLAY